MTPSRARPPHLSPKRSLGQNFLRDDNIARKIVGSLHIQPGDVLLEIGPGEGALTKHLRAVAGRLLAIEIDGRALLHLREEYAGDTVEILGGDFLEFDLASYAARAGRRIRVVGNIPYNRTSSILFRLLDHQEWIQDALLMMQREVARRLVATPRTKEYGILSVLCQLYSDVALLFSVSPRAFNPRPDVTSAVVHLRMLDGPRYGLLDEEFFRLLVRSIFGKRRKMLRNSLGYFCKEHGYPMPAGMDLSVRPEDLGVRQFVELSNTMRASRSGETVRPPLPSPL